MFRPLLISLCLTSTALATTWTVDDDGKADFDNIQAAIDASSDGDEIVVMEGMYYEHDINTLGKSILIEGSINTAGELLAVVHGNWQGSVFVCDSGETTSTVFKNLLITGGNALSGSGMYIEESAPSLVGCTFMNNYAIKGLGGGMHNWGSSPTLTNCTFTGNAAGGSGGGMFNNNNSSPTLTNCTFENNTSNDSGGGIHNEYSSNPTLENCIFTGNTANDGGGMHNQNSSGPTLTGCTFENNIANGGGGMFNYGGSSPTLTNCTFTGNTAPYGGGMFNSASSPTLENCTFENNTADTYGGGMYITGSSPTLTNCTFTGNTAALYGGGMYNSSGYPTLTDTTVCGNTPDQIYGSYIDGGGNTVTYDCPNPGACCTNNSKICVISEVEDCIFFGGQFLGDNTSCSDSSCPTACLGDVTGDGLVNTSDLLLIISVWGACP